MNKEILRLAIPNIISNISVPLLSSVDTALMGRLSGEYIGAVGVGSMIFNFIYWNFGFLRMGTTGITAQAFGRQDEPAIIHTLGRAVLVVLGAAGLILILQLPLGKASIWLMNIGDGQRQLVEKYFFIRVWAAPATLASYAFLGWFFGMQNAIYPLILTVVVNVVNIGLSFLLVFGFGMDIAGVAWGTVVAQYTGLLLALMLFFRRYGYLMKHFARDVVIQWQELQRFLRLNADIFIRTFCLTFVFGFFYSRSSVFGPDILAVNVILLQFLNWMSYGIDGFAFASESLVGKYAGARDEPKTLRAIRYSFAWGMVLAAFYALLYGVFGRYLLRLFTNQDDLIAAAQPFLFWMILFPLLSTPCYLWDGIFIGLTASRAMRNTMIAALIVFLSIFSLLAGSWGNHGLWMALLAFMLARGGFQHTLFARYGFRLR